MKYPKSLFRLSVLALLLMLASCQSRVIGANKPLYDNSLDLYKTYTVQTKDSKKYKIELVKTDATKLYGKTKTGEIVEIEKSEVREVTKTEYLTFSLLALAAIAAVIFVPI